MARDSKEYREIKIKALTNAIKTLKEESTISNNLVTFQNVVDTANEFCEGRINGKISPTSLKTPTSREFKKIKIEIEEYREEYKKIKEIVPRKSLKEVFILKNQVQNLMIEVAKFYDDKLLFNEKLEAKDRTIEKLRKERIDIYKRIEN
jgi:hypothetical protein